MFPAAPGDTVKVTYTGTLADGTVFDAADGQRPLHFILGKEEVLPAFEEGVLGMVRGERRTVAVPFARAYGGRREELVEVIDRKDLPADLQPRVGSDLEITMENGNILLVMVKDVTETTVTLDGNHPLAGKDLTFEIAMLDVSKPPSR